MRRAILVSLALAALGPLPTAAAPGLLVRVERRTPEDLRVLRSAGLGVVVETLDGLLLRGDEPDLERLRALGYEPRVLDAGARGASYVLVGLRPDSDLSLVAAFGPTLFQEDNLLVVRRDGGAAVSALGRARVFVGPIPERPVDPPRAEAAPPGAAPVAADPLVQKIVAGVSDASIQATWNALAANPPTGTRYSTAQGCRDAGAYCMNAYAAHGISAAYQTWNASHAPNVVATREGAISPGEVYIIEGHLDDLPASGLAPGADDNASGSVVVLESAKSMACWAFRNTVKYLNVTGEEFGLYGSAYYADDAAARDETIRAVINMDMPGWQGDGIPAAENLDLNYNSPSQWLAQRFVDAAASYGTGLAVNAVYCPSLNASDHYPFWQRGWSALCGITDNEGYCGQAGNYPYYHTGNDTIANCGSPAFFYSVVRASVATLAELAGPFKIAFDRSAYACGASLKVLVGDRDLDTDPGSPQSVPVRIWSASEPAGETVTLGERGPHSMIFEGSVPTTTGPAAAGDGVLTVVSGDVVEAEYGDALDCDGATGVSYRASAGTDCAAPVITGVGETGVTDASATIVWTTDEPSDSAVIWGQSTPPAQVVSEPSASTSHAVAIAGLQPCTVYYYEVRSVDPAGNAASDSDGGRYHHFETFGDFGSGPQPCHEGRITLEKPVLACQDVVPVTLVDMDLNLSATANDTVAVTVSSSTEPSPETLVLTETGPNTSTFRGSLPASAGPAAADGVLQLADGDLVTAAYRDADDGAGAPATAFSTGDADCAGPRITAIAVDGVTDDAATVRWTTSEPSNSRVDWGPTPVLGTVVSDAALVTEHAVTVGPLTECGRGYFRVRSTDARGNATSADVAGDPFAWSAYRIPGLWRDDFESPSGWTLEGEWQIAPPEGRGSPPGDPVAAFSGGRVLGHDLTGLGAHPGDYENGTTQRASSPIIDASALSHARIAFRRWLNGGGGSAVSSIEIKRGGTWYPVWTSGSFGIGDAAWSLQSVDVSTYADGNAALQIGFRQNGGPVFGGTRAGWNVDRVVLGSADQPDFDACGGCGGAPSFGGLASAADVSACADSGVALSWDPAAAWGTGRAGTYAVYRDADPGFLPTAANRIASGIAATGFTDAGAPGGVDLYYLVRAENDETCSSGPANGGVTDGNAVRRLARDETSPPPAGDVGATVRADGVNGAHVRLTWSPVPGAAAYRVYRADAPGSPGALAVKTVGTTWEDRDELGSPLPRYYRVRAIDACGNEGP